MKLEPDPDARARVQACVASIATVEFAGARGEPTPKSYYGRILGPPGPEREREIDRSIRFYLDVFETAGCAPQGLKVLEVGSGFGLGLIVVAGLGAAEANGVEIVPWQVEYALRTRDALPTDVGDRVKPVVGDAAELPYPAGTLDVVLSLEAISHYLDYEPFLDDAYRVLRPGGVLVISDGNNGLNPRIRRSRRRLWASHEADPYTEAVNVESPWLFVPKRERIVLATDPGLTPDLARELALRTSGMVQEQVEDEVRRYAEHGTLPDSFYEPGTLTVHPEQRMVMERLFDPFELGREIEARGFDVRVLGHWGGAVGSRAVRIANGILRSASRVTMPAARAFRIRAVKL